MEPRHRFIYAFDFDGTLTSRDSLLAIIRYAKGPLFFCLVMLRFAPLLVLMKLGRYSNSLLKQKLLARCFGGMPIGEFNKMCRTFAAAHTPILYIEGVRYLCPSHPCAKRGSISSAQVRATGSDLSSTSWS